MNHAPDKQRRTLGLTRRAWLLGVGAGAGALLTRQCAPTNHPGPPFPSIEAGVAPDGSVVLNDASLLSPTPVASHLTIRDDERQAVIGRLRAALAEARGSGRPFIASAARHSMGGHGQVILRMKRDGFRSDRLLVTVKVSELAALLNAYPLGDPGIDHLFDY